MDRLVTEGGGGDDTLPVFFFHLFLVVLLLLVRPVVVLLPFFPRPRFLRRRVRRRRELSLNVQQGLLRGASHRQYLNYDRPALTHAVRARHNLLLERGVVQRLRHENPLHERQVEALRGGAVQQQDGHVGVGAEGRERAVFIPPAHAYARDVREVHLGARERQIDHVEVGAEAAVHDALGRRTRCAPRPHGESLQITRVVPVPRCALVPLQRRGAQFPEPGQQVLNLRGLALRLQSVDHLPRELHVRRLNLDEILRDSLPRRGVIESRVRRLHLERRRAHGAPDRGPGLVQEILLGRARYPPARLVPDDGHAAAAEQVAARRHQRHERVDVAPLAPTLRDSQGIPELVRPRGRGLVAVAASLKRRHQVFDGFVHLGPEAVHRVHARDARRLPKVLHSLHRETRLPRVQQGLDVRRVRPVRE